MHIFLSNSSYEQQIDIKPAKLSPCKLGVTSAASLQFKARFHQADPTSSPYVKVWSEHPQYRGILAQVWSGVGVRQTTVTVFLITISLHGQHAILVYILWLGPYLLHYRQHIYPVIVDTIDA